MLNGDGKLSDKLESKKGEVNLKEEKWVYSDSEKHDLMFFHFTCKC